jgi:hypothetical protein
MAAAEPASETAMLPRMIDVVMLVATARIMTYPLVIVMDVRSFRVIGLIAKGAMLVLWPGFRCAILRGARRIAARGWRTV